MAAVHCFACLVFCFVVALQKFKNIEAHTRRESGNDPPKPEIIIGYRIPPKGALPSSCQSFFLSTIEKSYLPSDVITINASCYDACPSWDIKSSYPDDIKVILNYTIDLPGGRCVRNMSFQANHFESLNNSLQLTVVFSNPRSEPDRIINVEKSDNLEHCRQDWDCYHTDQKCLSGYCDCPPEYSFVSGLGKCYPVVSRYYGECQFTEQCQAYKSICKNSVCQCADNYLPDENTPFNCIPGGARNLGQTCAADYSCQQRNSKTLCTNGYCACKPHYFQSYSGDCFPSARKVGEPCAGNENCEQVCFNGLCACRYDDFHVDGVCYSQEAGFGEICLNDDNCRNWDIMCSNGYCACKSNYIRVHGSCQFDNGSFKLDCGWTGILLTAFYVLFTFYNNV